MDLFINIKEALEFELRRKYKQSDVLSCSNFDGGNLVIAFKIIQSELFKASDGLQTVLLYQESIIQILLSSLCMVYCSLKW